MDINYNNTRTCVLKQNINGNELSVSEKIKKNIEHIYQ